MTAPQRSSPPPVEPLKCGRCGGSFQEADAACPWCGAGIALEDRGRAQVCVRCGVRAPAEREWCPGCGQRLGEQALAPLSAGATCPACRGALRERQLEEHAVVECGGCGGLWLAADRLDAWCAEAERAGIADLAPDPVPAPRAERVLYRPCPACADLMQRRNFGGSSGVVVDVCRAHGVWLDHLELEHVLAWARGGGLERERERRVERARRAERPAPAWKSPMRALESPGPAWVEPGLGLLEILAGALKRLG